MTLTEETFLSKALEDLQQQGLKRELKQVSGSQSSCITIDGKEVLNFCSNNYLGLADDPCVKEAAINGIHQEGFGSGASRLICGNMSSHGQLEKCIADFKGVERCLLFSTGYMANVGIIASLFGREDIIFSDKLNHASIIDGMQLSQAQWKRYPHRDMRALEEMLKSSVNHRKRCIITDSVFSMDGDIAPLDAIVALAKKHDCLVMIDEAHAFGVLGQNGKGVAEYFGVEQDIDIQMGTLSKAAGSFGAYCCGSAELITFLMNKARSFIYTTGLPPSVAAASMKSIEIIRDQPQRRAQLWKNSRYMMQAVKNMGFNTMDSQTPIIPLIVGSSEIAVDFSKRLFEKGVFVSAIRPPTVPKGKARLRLTVMATHTQGQLDYALEHIGVVGKELCLI